jgi:MYXO-CTERM domain-containing protein
VARIERANVRSKLACLSSFTSRRAARIAIAVATCALAVGASRDASAFVLKHAPSGADVHWTTKTVTFELTTSLDDLPGASDAVPRALAAWGGIAGAPTLAVATTDNDIRPANDGHNIVYYAKNGYPAAGSALAVSVLSYDASTGALVDADIVINGGYDFALLADGTTSTPGAPMVSTDGDGAPPWRAGTFDLIEVLSHEVGHCLGLAHDMTDSAAIMFPMVAPEDVARRDPSPDDVAGVESDYASVTLGASDASTGSGGCSAGSAALKSGPSWVAALALAGVAAVTRRRRALQRA